MMFTETPLRIPRLILLFLTFVFAVVSFSVGINAAVKSIQQRNKVYNEAPKGTTVKIDFSDIFDVGAVLTAGCGVLFIVSAFSLVSLFRPLRNNSAHFLRIQEWALFFCAIWIFATVIPYDVFFATRSAKVTASLGGVSVSQAIIQSIEKSLGVSPVYKESGFCK
ncbi:hypothetical protein SCLCIDRAFT_979116 [Scleroderma citrinum Foug A]|uniref:Uncharacterized protein n=1 Tax=Scleroderma citrinum Foug A TaxID=1036808 RepID=A0A0C3DUR4_9AGAM|nr:hypothetical protein SCLCIDRAFT_979116 [Scleroderma citrinum Foug A]